MIEMNVMTFINYHQCLQQHELYYLSYIIQQNQMSIIMKDNQDKYHQNNYYRHNPYSNQGYLPPVSLKNRKQPQYLSQIPQGIQYFQNSSRKHYPQQSNQNTIGLQNILSHPQRYPLQNTLANDKEFLRNLCTLDIEGANANSKKSLAVKNRIKAQQQLMRRNAPIITPLIFNGNTQEFVRKKLAQEQLGRVNSRQSKSLDSRQRNYRSQKNLRGVEYYNKNPYVQKRDFAMQIEIQDIINKKLTDKIHYKGQNSKSDQIEDKKDYQYSSIASNPEQLQKQKKQLQNELIQRFGKSNNSNHKLVNPTYLSYDGSAVRKSGILSGLARNILLG